MCNLSRGRIVNAGGAFTHSIGPGPCKEYCNTIDNHVSIMKSIHNYYNVGVMQQSHADMHANLANLNLMNIKIAVYSGI